MMNLNAKKLALVAVSSLSVYVAYGQARVAPRASDPEPWSTVPVGPERSQTQHQTASKIKLGVLYAGVEKDAVTPEFLNFLKQHFSKVGFASYSDFKPQMADGYNVVIFDAPAHPTAFRIGLPPTPRIPESYDRASILMSGGGAMIGMELKLKIDWW